MLNNGSHVDNFVLTKPSYQLKACFLLLHSKKSLPTTYKSVTSPRTRLAYHSPGEEEWKKKSPQLLVVRGLKLIMYLTVLQRPTWLPAFKPAAAAFDVLAAVLAAVLTTAATHGSVSIRPAVFPRDLLFLLLPLPPSPHTQPPTTHPRTTHTHHHSSYHPRLLPALIGTVSIIQDRKREVLLL